MNCAIVQFGSQTAPDSGGPSPESAFLTQPPKTLGDLLTLIDKSTSKELPMLRSTAAKLAEFHNLQFDEISLDKILQMRSQFRRYLEGRKYAENSVRSYVNYVRILIYRARALGWRPCQGLPEAWQQVLALAPKRKCTDTAQSFAVIMKSPRDITAEDVDNWVETQIQQGVSHKVAAQKRCAFWQLLRECGMTDYRPLSSIRADEYGATFGQLPLSLRTEVDELLRWKTAEFAIDRPKGVQIRQSTADKIREKVQHLFGFATNVRGLFGFDSLAGLIQKGLLTDYVSWCLNERAVLGETLRNHLGKLDLALRQHPSYASLDLSWFRPLLESLPARREADRRMRKEKKYLDYSVIETIPDKIRADRISAGEGCSQQTAWLAMEELLIKWLLGLAWRQRNIRECRIGGPHPNVFKGKVPNNVAIDMPDWVRAEEQRNPGAVFWQMHFMPDETKTGKEVRAFIPRPLINPLEEYLMKFRPHLVQNSSALLFISRDGTPLTRGRVYNLVTRLTSRYGGRSVNPHLFRDIVAFAWLKAHPKDYLTLSKILWHANITVTIKTYGSQFDESSGVCAMEEWLEERERSK